MKITKSLNNQRGGAMLVMVLIVAVMVSYFIYATSTPMGVAFSRKRATRDSLAAMDVMSNMASLLKQGYDTKKMNAGGCPANTSLRTLGTVQFCLPSAAASNCVFDPRGSLDAEIPPMICAVEMSPTSYPGYPGGTGTGGYGDSPGMHGMLKIELIRTPIPHDALRTPAREFALLKKPSGRMPASLKSDANILSLFESKANALSLSDPKSADLASPTNSIVTPACPGGLNPLCMSCAGAVAGNDSRLDCVKISVCMVSSCAAPNQDKLITETFGMM